MALRQPIRCESVPASGIPTKLPTPKPRRSVPRSMGESSSPDCTKGMRGAQEATVKPPVKKPMRADQSSALVAAPALGLASVLSREIEREETESRSFDVAEDVPAKDFGEMFFVNSQDIQDDDRG